MVLICYHVDGGIQMVPLPMLPHKREKKKRAEKRSNLNGCVKQRHSLRKNKRSIDSLVWPPSTMTICVCVHRLPISPPFPCPSFPAHRPALSQWRASTSISSPRGGRSTSRVVIAPSPSTPCPLRPPLAPARRRPTKHGLVVLRVVVAGHV